MKVAVVGSSHGGFETVRGVLHDFPNAEIDWYEKGDFVSFLSCGIEKNIGSIQKGKYANLILCGSDLDPKQVWMHGKKCI